MEFVLLVLEDVLYVVPLTFVHPANQDFIFQEKSVLDAQLVALTVKVKITA